MKFIIIKYPDLTTNFLNLENVKFCQIIESKESNIQQVKVCLLDRFFEFKCQDYSWHIFYEFLASDSQKTFLFYVTG